MGNIVNRVFDSSGPEGKVRGTPQQIIDKYNQLARDAQLGNDRVAAENFQQHAEHYLRMLAEAQREQNERREQQEREQEARREREERDRSERRDRSEQPQPDIAPAVTPPPAAGEGDAVMDVAESADSGLVETPESKPSRPRRSRKPKPAADGGDESPESQEAAE